MELSRTHVYFILINLKIYTIHILLFINQGLVGAVFEGVGVSCGSFIAGSLFENYNGSLTFRYFGIGALILFLVHVVTQKILELTQGKIKLKQTRQSNEISRENISKPNLENNEIKKLKTQTNGTHGDDEFKEIDLTKF